MAREAPRTMGKEWAVVLADLPLFEGLSKRQLGKIAKLGVARRLAPLTPIVRQGNTGNAFYVILTGNAVVRVPAGAMSYSSRVISSVRWRCWTAPHGRRWWKRRMRSR